VSALLSNDLIVLGEGSYSIGSASVPKQIGLTESFQAAKRLKLDQDLSKALLYQGNCSHGMLTENQHFKKVIQDLAHAGGLPGYVPPNRYKVSNKLLNYHYDELSRTVTERFLSTGSTAAELVIPRTLTGSFDGWDNASRTHLLGVVGISRAGAVFLKSIDTTGVELMGKDWTLQVIRDVVAMMGGPEVVAGVVLDSPSVNKSALEAFEHECPLVACLLCVCHIISLFLKDVFEKIQAVKLQAGIVNQISKKFRGVKWLKEMLQLKQTTLPLNVSMQACAVADCVCCAASTPIQEWWFGIQVGLQDPVWY